MSVFWKANGKFRLWHAMCGLITAVIINIVIVMTVRAGAHRGLCCSNAAMRGSATVQIVHTYASYTSNVCCGDFFVRTVHSRLSRDGNQFSATAVARSHTANTDAKHAHTHLRRTADSFTFSQAQLTDHRCALLRSVFSIIAHHDKYAHISHLPRAFVRV